MLKEYQDDDFVLHLDVVDDMATMTTEPFIEQITKQDIINVYKHLLKYKPKHFPVNDYKRINCYDCDLNPVIHRKQQFCPRCYNLDIYEDENDVNQLFEELFTKWQKMKLFVERILNGNILRFIDDFNAKLTPENAGQFMGDEILVGDKDSALERLKKDE